MNNIDVKNPWLALIAIPLIIVVIVFFFRIPKQKRKFLKNRLSLGLHIVMSLTLAAAFMDIRFLHSGKSTELYILADCSDSEKVSGDRIDGVIAILSFYAKHDLVREAYDLLTGFIDGMMVDADLVPAVGIHHGDTAVPDTHFVDMSFLTNRDGSIHRQTVGTVFFASYRDHDLLSRGRKACGQKSHGQTDDNEKNKKKNISSADVFMEKGKQVVLLLIHGLSLCFTIC